MLIDKKKYDRVYAENIQLKRKLEKFENDIAFKKQEQEIKHLKHKCAKTANSWENKYNKLKRSIDHERYLYNRRLNDFFGCHNVEVFPTFNKSEKELFRDLKKVISKYEDIINDKDKIINDLEDRIESLRARINKDSTNSGIPSSKCNFKNIPNSRKKSNKKVGGQIGHEPHKRKKFQPTEPAVYIETDKKFLDADKYRETNRYKVKDVVDIKVSLEVTRYKSKIFIERKTGKEKFTSFPANINNETNYGANIKAFTFLLNNQCNVSINKVNEFLRNITNQQLTICDATISNFLKEFSNKSKEEIIKLEENLFDNNILGCDFTGARCSGNNNHVLVATGESGSRYYACKKKGHKGIEGTLLENYCGILVHDHDPTFYHYGRDHQECLAHILRYLKAANQNEPEKQWPKLMFEILSKIIHDKNTNMRSFSKREIKNINKLYDEAINIAQVEYAEHPPNKYNKEAFNLYKRLERTKENVLLLIYNTEVPPTNNASERALRKVVRKKKQMITFRSFDNFDCYCNALSMLSTWTQNKENVLENSIFIFNKA